MQKTTSKGLDERTDEEIAIAVQKGQHDNFAILAQRYTQKLIKYALRYVGTQDAAHDIVQDVMMKAHQKIDSFDSARKFSPWIYRITHNESVNYLKKHRSHTRVSLDAQLSLMIRGRWLMWNFHHLTSGLSVSSKSRCMKQSVNSQITTLKSFIYDTSKNSATKK